MTKRSMKAINEKHQTALDRFTKSEYWRSVYEGAPERAKAYIEHGFYVTQTAKTNDDVNAMRADHQALADKLTAEDWQYLADRYGTNPRERKYYQSMADKLAKN